jgi:hypothetical protein
MERCLAEHPTDYKPVRSKVAELMALIRAILDELAAISAPRQVRATVTPKKPPKRRKKTRKEPSAFAAAPRGRGGAGGGGG